MSVSSPRQPVLREQGQESSRNGSSPRKAHRTARGAATPLTPHVAWWRGAPLGHLCSLSTLPFPKTPNTQTQLGHHLGGGTQFTATRGIQHERQRRNQTEASDAMSLGLRFTLFVFVDKSKVLPRCPLRGERLSA